ncbi:hypothetical protein Bca52824_002088 [Brassica carinata]|uniref:Uncharacterized protein n=1 Tax=Brassica carinata TaxID=52824 RepID=A0A8X8BDZ8_BRACI|nr:hypothetical protein Bca52824_002088 [Brassica carinata]
MTVALISLPQTPLAVPTPTPISPTPANPAPMNPRPSAPTSTSSPPTSSLGSGISGCLASSSLSSSSSFSSSPHWLSTPAASSRFDPAARIGFFGLDGLESDFGALGVPWCKHLQIS